MNSSMQRLGHWTLRCAAAAWALTVCVWPCTASVITRSGTPTADERAFWSFQPPKEPAVPQPHDGAWNGSPIDQFVRAALEAKGLAPVKQADRRTLIRRATYDLTGLPPAQDEIAAFLNDAAPDAYPKLIDRLLASPAYGERWGRHWLDVVRYADTAGETADFPVREAWKYRNWVIDAFNRDEPYDQFVREQVAGDILATSAPPADYARLVTATGYLAISRRFGFDSENYQHLMFQDTIDNLGQTMLGLSLGCARCHDHKFDPISMADYYALYGIFNSTTFAFPGCEKHNRPSDFPAAVAPAEAVRLKHLYDEQVAKLDTEIRDANAKLATPPAPKVAVVAGAPATQPSTQASTAPAATMPVQALDPHVRDAIKAAKADAEKRKQALVAAGPYDAIYGVAEGHPQNARIQKRGEPTKLGDETPRRWLDVLGGDPLPATEKGSGRLELADWLTRPGNPLTARVMVNRIWQFHFGVGIVQTENDFGTRGKRPTHPELLDWLARRFIDGGWSVKAMHRLIMNSRAYQLSSDFSAPANQADPDDDSLWRFRRRRLDAEEIRDAMLVLGGDLDRTPGESHPFPPVNTWGFSQHAPFYGVYDTNRRSVYLMVQRMARHPFLELFDGADANVGTARRDETTVPTQALYMMNAPFVHQQSEHFARRLLATQPDPKQWVPIAHQQALGRDPADGEVERAIGFLDQYRGVLDAAHVPADQQPARACAAYLRTVICGNEFLFVD